MPNKIDEFFSPERLRTNWQITKERAYEPVQTERNKEAPRELLKHLQDLTQVSFSGEDAVALNLLLDDLYAHIEQLFPKDGESAVPADSLTDMLPAIHDKLNRIEDMAEAFEIARRYKKRS